MTGSFFFAAESAIMQCNIYSYAIIMGYLTSAITTSTITFANIFVATLAFLLLLAASTQVAFAGTISPGVDCSSGAAAPLGEYSVDPSLFPIAAYTADSLSPNFLNSAGSVFQVSYWTTQNVKFFQSSNSAQFILASKYCSRDEEVETWTRQGVVYLRLTPAGKALFFDLNQESANGTLVIGIATGVNETQFNAGARKFLYSNVNLVGTIPGYSKSDKALVTAQRFTFGVEGFDIYAKLNGVEFLRIKDFRHVVSGKAALKALGASGHGFRMTTVRNFSDTPLLSDIANSTFDVRDFGFRSIQTTGSISAGSNALTLAGASTFAVGDYVIVETGKEPGSGNRGTKGVGGTWPTKSYANLAAMQADTSQVNLLFAWLEDTGDVYQYATSNSTWTKYPAARYYPAKAVPKALVARVTAIQNGGATITLDKTAAVSVTNANVYLDTAPIVNFLTYPRWYKFGGTSGDFAALMPPNMRVSIPAGTYAAGGQIYFGEKTNAELYGTGADSTTIFTPDGAPNVGIQATGGTASTVRDLHLIGNARDHGFALNWTPGILPMGYGDNGVMETSIMEGGVTETNLPQGTSYSAGIMMTGTDMVTRGVKVDDVFQKAVAANYCTNCWAYNSQNYMTDGLRTYVQWQFQWSDVIGGGCIDCTVTSPKWLIAGFETFRSPGVQFIRPKSLNASFSSNSSGNFLFQDADVVITPMSQHPDKAFSANVPIFNINSNIQPPTPDILLGGRIVNPHIVIQGPINSDNNGLLAIGVNASNPNITITGGYVSGPNWRTGATLNTPVGVNSTGVNTIVDGLQVVGTASASVWPAGNINVSNGVVKNCIADIISVGANATVQNCITKTQTDVTPPSVPGGLSSTAPSSSQINLTWTASADSVGVTGYKIYRNGAQVGTTTTNSYSDTSLTASTVYSYTISAFDAAGNNSAQSASLSDITFGAATPAIAVGSRVTTSANLNFRASASLSATKLGTESVGSLGTIIGGPTTASGHTWWQVNYDNGLSGWSVGDYLGAASAASSPAVGMSAPALLSQIASAADQIATLQAAYFIPVQ